jgi:hypothetical protein
VLECRDLLVPLPEFHIVAVDKLLGAHFRSVVVIADKIEASQYVAVRFEEVGVVFAHYFGGFKPGDCSHSLRCAAISA